MWPGWTHPIGRHPALRKPRIVKVNLGNNSMVPGFRSRHATRIVKSAFVTY